MKDLHERSLSDLDLKTQDFDAIYEEFREHLLFEIPVFRLSTEYRPPNSKVLLGIDEGYFAMRAPSCSESWLTHTLEINPGGLYGIQFFRSKERIHGDMVHNSHQIRRAMIKACQLPDLPLMGDRQILELVNKAIEQGLIYVYEYVSVSSIKKISWTEPNGLIRTVDLLKDSDYTILVTGAQTAPYLVVLEGYKSPRYDPAPHRSFDWAVEGVMADLGRFYREGIARHAYVSCQFGIIPSFVADTASFRTIDDYITMQLDYPKFGKLSDTNNNIFAFPCKFSIPESSILDIELYDEKTIEAEVISV